MRTHAVIIQAMRRIGEAMSGQAEAESLIEKNATSIYPQLGCTRAALNHHGDGGRCCGTTNEARGPDGVLTMTKPPIVIAKIAVETPKLTRALRIDGVVAENDLLAHRLTAIEPGQKVYDL